MHTSRNNCPIVVSSEEELFQRLVERSKGELTGTIDYKKSLENISQNGHSLEGVIRLVHTLGQRLLTKQEPPSQCYKFAAELESVMEAYGQITNDFQLEADSHQLIFDLSLPLALETNNTTHEADLRMDLIEGLLLENLESTFSSKIEAELQNCAANIESLGSHARLDQRLRYSRITLECMIVEAPSNLRELVVKRISSVQGLYNDIRPGDHDAAKEYVRSLVIGGTFLISEDALTREQLQFCESSASEALEMMSIPPLFRQRLFK